MVEHPAKFSDVILKAIEPLLAGYEKVLDPFAGTGRLREIQPDAYLIEIEPEWAEIASAEVGNALDLQYPDGFFDACATSPCYGNRMADHFEDHQKEKGYKRHTYRHYLGRPLHPDNAGQLQWGKKYRDFHRRAWAEVYRVLRSGGRFILNISDHIRAGKRVEVSEWHCSTILQLGFQLENCFTVETPRQRHGANRNLRVDHENIYVFKKDDRR